MIILDPAYKVRGDRDENANGAIASLMNEQALGVAVNIDRNANAGWQWQSRHS